MIAAMLPYRRRGIRPIRGAAIPVALALVLHLSPGRAAAQVPC